MVLVAEADQALGHLRRRLDPSAAQGMPAHITVMYPFLPSRQIDARVLRRLQAIFSSAEPFDLSLSQVGSFGDRVLYIAPHPSAPLRHLTAAVEAAFPMCRPYGGMFDEVVPHLTVGEDAGAEVLREAAVSTERVLPIRARASAVSLMLGPTGTPGSLSWSVGRHLPLGRHAPVALGPSFSGAGENVIAPERS